jgi:glycosyltransferase involved in cell wall biosynthesis
VPESDLAATRADVIVALTSHNDARTIATVARGLQDALVPYASTCAIRLVLADAGSTDGTREAAREVLGTSALMDVHYSATAELRDIPYHGQPHRAGVLRAVLQTAQRLEARACAVVDASRQSAEPELIERLLAPVLTGGFDYVSPYYVRHVHQGAITRGIVYPVFRALYGPRLRQPAASEFGCSRRLLSHYLDEDFWEFEYATIGIDLWLAVVAACGDFRICEAVLGPRLATARGGSADLSTTLAQLVGALFIEVEHLADVWQRVRGSVEVPIVGTLPAASSEGPPLDLEGLQRSYRLGYRELRDIWASVLPPRTIIELRKLADATADRFAFDDRLWATIIYDFAFGYSLRVMPRDHLLRSLTPLYNGWLASFAGALHGATVVEVENRVERLCLAFETEKRYLISRWRWPERHR